MRAITYDAFGPSSVLKISEVPTPRPGPGEVLVRLTHTSVNPVDWKIREGYLQKALPHHFPIIPGWDAAGVVAELGEGAHGFVPGDHVFAYARLPEVHSGTYAEYIALPVAYLAHKPTAISLADAAAVPLVGLTAFQALHDVAALKAGESILVTAGAGGVGSFAIQLAAIAGATVTTTAGPDNAAYVTALGATHVIDYRRGQTVADAQRLCPGGFDVVFDCAGGSALADAARVIKDGGRLVSIVDTPKAELFGDKRVRSAYHFVAPNGAQLTALARLLEEGRLKLPAIQVRNVREAAAAMDENQARHVRGKVVLAIDF